MLRALLFQTLRLYVAIERPFRAFLRWFQTLRLYVAIERPFRAFLRWWRGEGPDVVLHPLPQPDVVPDAPVDDRATPVFLSSDGSAAYAPAYTGSTLRRVVQDEEGQILYAKKLTKQQRRAMKRAKGRNGTDRRTAAGA